MALYYLLIVLFCFAWKTTDGKYYTQIVFFISKMFVSCAFIYIPSFLSI